MADDQKATAEDYAFIFEQHRVGQKVFNDLYKRFAFKKSSNGDGINRVLDNFEYQGQRNVIDHIALKIEQANEARINDDIQVSVDE